MEADMSHHRRTRLSRDEIATAFAGDSEFSAPPIISPKQLASILGLSRSTIYLWIEDGRLDGCYRKRGKHVLLWRDRAIEIIFNGPEWSNANE